MQRPNENTRVDGDSSKENLKSYIHLDISEDGATKINESRPIPVGLSSLYQHRAEHGEMRVDTHLLFEIFFAPLALTDEDLLPVVTRRSDSKSRGEHRIQTPEEFQKNSITEILKKRLLRHLGPTSSDDRFERTYIRDLFDLTRSYDHKHLWYLQKRIKDEELQVKAIVGEEKTYFTDAISWIKQYWNEEHNALLEAVIEAYHEEEVGNESDDAATLADDRELRVERLEKACIQASRHRDFIIEKIESKNPDYANLPSGPLKQLDFATAGSFIGFYLLHHDPNCRNPNLPNEQRFGKLRRTISLVRQLVRNHPLKPKAVACPDGHDPCRYCRANWYSKERPLWEALSDFLGNLDGILRNASVNFETTGKPGTRGVPIEDILGEDLAFGLKQLREEVQKVLEDAAARLGASCESSLGG